MKKVVGREELKKLLEELIAAGEVVAPVKDGELILFRPVENTEDILLDYTNPVNPAKEFFFPSREELFSHGPDKVKLIDLSRDRKRIILGIRPCDAKSLLLLDKMFSGEYKDPYYLSKRKGSTLIGLACNNPEKSCFCLSLGGGPHSKEGLDALLTELGDGNYLVETVTPQGEKLFKAYGQEAKKADVDRKKAREEEAKKGISKSCPIPTDLEPVFEHPYWEKVSRKCIACGICTYLCPTCFCFNLSDEGGARVRYWDSCSFACFTKMTSGENPREEKWKRYRQRVYHKFSYFKKDFNEIACVGCGRCLRECPVQMDITEVVDDAQSLST